jgi:hypothetical protein
VSDRARAGWTPRELRFKAAYDAVAEVIEGRWQIPVVISDVLDPNTGDFNGAEILLDHTLDLEVALFVLAHLFGHTAQWSTDPGARDLGTRYASVAPPEEVLPAIRDYERDASRIAMQLFHEAGVTDLDGWLSDWAAADWGYLEHFYRTGERGDFRVFFREDAPRLTPLPIPAFQAQRWVSRYSF